MKRCTRLLSAYEKMVKTDCDVYKLKIEADWKKIKFNFLSLSHKYDVIVEKDRRIYEYIYYWQKRISDGTNMKDLINTLIFDIFVNEYKGLTPLIFRDDKGEIIFCRLSLKNIPEQLTHILCMLNKSIDLDFCFTDYHELPDLIQYRSISIKHWYIKENGSFFQYMLDSFQDTISQISFISYLKQRFLAKLHGGYDAPYPVHPPKETLAWRTARLASASPLPVIQGVSQKELKFYYETTFLLEQYAIENTVGVKQGDIVIDAGGFVGDTALYFALKCGPSGKVYSFEPIPRIVKIAKKNIEINNFIGIIEMVPFALSDKCRNFSFLDMASGSHAIDGNSVQRPEAAHVVNVKSITLDRFVDLNKIPHVDFIKSDLEGWDMAFLRGAASTIKAYKPTCGLTLYHKSQDIIEIPQFLQLMDERYKFWFRSETEPVLFAKI